MNPQNDGQLDLPNLTPEQIQEKFTEVQTEMEKHKEANTQRTQEAQKLDRVLKVSKDKSEFIKLHDTDKKLAEKVVEYNNEFYWESYSIEDYLSHIKGDKKSVDKDDELLDKLETRQEWKVADKFYVTYLAEKVIDSESDFWKDVISLYDDLMDWKKNNQTNVKKYLDIALREAKNTSEFAEAYNEAVKSAQWPGWVKSSEKGFPRRTPKKPQRAAIFDYLKKD